MVARVREGLGPPSLRNICLAGGILGCCLRARACRHYWLSARGGKRSSFYGYARESDMYAPPIGPDVTNDRSSNGGFWSCLPAPGCRQARSCSSVHSVRIAFQRFSELAQCCLVDRQSPEELRQASRPAKIRRRM